MEIQVLINKVEWEYSYLPPHLIAGRFTCLPLRQLPGFTPPPPPSTSSQVTTNNLPVHLPRPLAYLLHYNTLPSNPLTWLVTRWWGVTLSLEVCGHQSSTCWWSGDTETSTSWSLSPTDWCNTDAPGLSRIYLRVPHLSGPLGDPTLPSFVQAELAISTSRSSEHACVLKLHWLHCDNTVEKKTTTLN